MSREDWTRDHRIQIAGIVAALLGALAGSLLTAWIDRPPRTLTLTPPSSVAGLVPTGSGAHSPIPTTGQEAGSEPVEDGSYPARAGYSCRGQDCSVAPTVTLDSAVNNPEVGDERVFLCGSIGGAPVADRVQVAAGSLVNVRMYVDNNADPQGQPKQDIAENVTVTVLLPTTHARWFNLVGAIHSDNATPSEVNDPMLLVGNQQLRLEYVRGSAQYFHLMDGHQVEDPLSDAIVSREGVGIGNVRPGTTNGGYIVLQVRVLPG